MQLKAKSLFLPKYDMSDLLRAFSFLCIYLANRLQFLRMVVEAFQSSNSA